MTSAHKDLKLVRDLVYKVGMKNTIECLILLLDPTDPAEDTAALFLAEALHAYQDRYDKQP